MDKNVFRRVFLAGLVLLLGSEKSSIAVVNCSEFSCNKGESLFLFRKSSAPLVWESSDEDIAQVKDGIVFAKKEGSCTILSKSGKNIDCYKIKINTAKRIKNAAYLSNDGNLKIFAITSRDVENLELRNKGKTLKILGKNSFTNGENLFWELDVSTDGLVIGNFNFEILPIKSGILKNENAYVIMGNFFNKNNLKNEDCFFGKNISKKGVEFIMEWEGFVPSLSEDRLVPGVYNIGNGDVINFGETFYNNITKEQAFVDLVNKLNTRKYVNDVNKFIKENKIKCTQQQFDALVSFSYNLGTRWLEKSGLKDVLLSSLEPGTNIRNLSFVNVEKLVKEALIWHHVIVEGRKICILGLLYRRISELDLFLHNEYSKESGKLNRYNYSVPGCIKGKLRNRNDRFTKF